MRVTATSGRRSTSSRRTSAIAADAGLDRREPCSTTTSPTVRGPRSSCRSAVRCRPTDAIEVRRLPRIRAATLIVRGAYEAIEPARRALDGWVAAAGLAAAGPLRILYLQFGAEADLRLAPDYLVERDEDFVTELQLPVA